MSDFKDQFIKGEKVFVCRKVNLVSDAYDWIFGEIIEIDYNYIYVKLINAKFDFDKICVYAYQIKKFENFIYFIF
jgi:hypothetical protein